MQKVLTTTGWTVLSIAIVFHLFCLGLMFYNQINYGYFAYITLPELFGF